MARVPAWRGLDNHVCVVGTTSKYLNRPCDIAGLLSMARRIQWATLAIAYRKADCMRAPPRIMATTTYQLLSATTKQRDGRDLHLTIPVGNRLSSAGVPSYSYNNSNELTSNSNATFGYDLNGNAVTKRLNVNHHLRMRPRESCLGPRLREK